LVETTGLTTRTSYLYKVVAVSAAADGAIQYESDPVIAAGNFYRRADATLTGTLFVNAAATTARPGDTSATVPANSVVFWLNGPQAANVNVFDNEEIRIYYWQGGATTQLENAKFVTISKGDAEAIPANPLAPTNAEKAVREKVAGSLTYGQQYSYAVYIKTADTKLTLLRVTGLSYSLGSSTFTPVP
jgi:hypothetical protein